jgi:hypothetical protein
MAGVTGVAGTDGVGVVTALVFMATGTATLCTELLRALTSDISCEPLTMLDDVPLKLPAAASTAPIIQSPMPSR